MSRHQNIHVKITVASYEYNKVDRIVRTKRIAEASHGTKTSLMREKKLCNEHSTVC
jgi:hypothetical protein